MQINCVSVGGWNSPKKGLNTLLLSLKNPPLQESPGPSTEGPDSVNPQSTFGREVFQSTPQRACNDQLLDDFSMHDKQRDYGCMTSNATTDA